MVGMKFDKLMEKQISMDITLRVLVVVVLFAGVINTELVTP